MRSSVWLIGMGSALVRSTRITFRNRSISMVRLAIRIRAYEDRRWSTPKKVLRLPRNSKAGISRYGLRMDRTIRELQISGSARSGLRICSGKLTAEQRLLVEYKPFEPAFYHTDIADWGMALLLARAAGPQARVLVDTGHHYQSQNIEQIVAWLLSENMLGGFHFNDRRYADDDLTLGSI